MAQPALEFIKMSGAGNDFIVADNRAGSWGSLDLPALARGLCRRGLSVGADGLILLEASRKARFRLRHFNPDGSEPTLCGNGVRCAARFAFMKVIAGRQMNIETPGGVLQAEILPDGEVCIEMPVRLSPLRTLKLEIEGRSLAGYLADAGVPHLVLFVKDIEKAPVESLGPRLRSHPALGEAGANVDFAARLEGDDHYAVRVFERGVEGETLACGTGATAVAWVVHHLGKRPPAVRLRMRSGKDLTVAIRDDRTPPGVTLTGEASFVYQGRLSEEALVEALKC